MRQIKVTMVRIYLTEAQGKLDPLMKRLHDWEKVRGVTVFRGISGFGKSGMMHSSTLLDMSLDLPVVVEFFDEPDKVSMILEHLSGMFAPGHIISWSADLMIDDQQQEQA
jgi:PII-like signaling protein